MAKVSIADRIIQILTIIATSLIAIPIILVLAIIGLFIYLDGRPHPSDEELLKSLSSNQPKYEQLIQMFQTDQPLKVVHPTWIDPENGINQARWEQYKAIFKELKLDAGMRVHGNTGLEFTATAKGLATGGSSKGLVYATKNLAPLYKNLDTLPPDLQSNVTGYRKINKFWYIYYEWDD